MISVLLMKNPCCKLIFFVLSVLRQAATVCYLEKWQKLTRDDLKARRWLPSPHCPERFQEQATPKAQQSPPSLSPFLSSSLSRRTKLSSVEYSRRSGRSSGRQCLLFKERQQGKSLWHAQGSTGDLYLYVKQRRTRPKEWAEPTHPKIESQCNHQLVDNRSTSHLVHQERLKTKANLKLKQVEN